MAQPHIQIDEREVRRRLRDIYSRIVKERPYLIAEGIRWYPEAQAFARTLALTHNISFEQAAGIIAVTSQRASWEYQLQHLSHFIYDLRRNKKSRPYQFLGESQRKAAEILRNYNLEVIRGPKIRDFYHAILSPVEHAARPVIDTWMVKACISYHAVGTRGLTCTQYRALQECVAAVAREVGLYTPLEFQAIIWVWARQYLHLYD